MSDLEMCFNCDQPTGKAGAMEDSQMIEGKPYCEDGYDECVIETIDSYANEIRELKAQLADAVVREKEIRIEANYAGGVANDLHAKLVGLVRAGNNLRLQYALMTNRTDSIAVATKQDWDEALKAIKEVKV